MSNVASSDCFCTAQDENDANIAKTDSKYIILFIL